MAIGPLLEEYVHLQDDSPAGKPSSEPVLNWEEGIHERLGFCTATVSLVVSMVGTGIVAFPYAFALTGYFVGPLVLMIISVLAHLAYISLQRCAAVTYQSSYDGLLKRLPPFWARISNIALGLLLILATTAYILIAADIFRSVALVMGSSLASYGNAIIFAGILGIMFPLCLTSSLHGLSGISTFCSIAIVVVVCIIFYEAASFHQEKTASSVLVPFTSTTPTLMSLPILGCALFGHMNFPRIFAELRSDVKPLAPMISLVSCAIVFAVYLGIGIVGYAAFGDKTAADIVSQLASARPGWLIYTAQTLLASFIVLKTPLLLFPLRCLVLAEIAPSATLENLPRINNVLLSLVLLVCVYAAALMLPQLDFCLEILGVSCVIPLCFIIPARLSWTIEKPVPTFRCLAMMSVGALVSSLSCIAVIGAKAGWLVA